MNDVVIQRQLDYLHKELSKHEQVEGSLLLTDTGTHISSSLTHSELEVRQLSDGIGYLFRYLNEISEINELSFKLRGRYFHLKHVPSKKIILSVISKQDRTRNLEILANMYARVFQDII